MINIDTNRPLIPQINEAIIQARDIGSQYRKTGKIPNEVVKVLNTLTEGCDLLKKVVEVNKLSPEEKGRLESVCMRAAVFIDNLHAIRLEQFIDNVPIFIDESNKEDAKIHLAKLVGEVSKAEEILSQPHSDDFSQRLSLLIQKAKKKIADTNELIK